MRSALRIGGCGDGAVRLGGCCAAVGKGGGLMVGYHKSPAALAAYRSGVLGCSRLGKTDITKTGGKVQAWHGIYCPAKWTDWADVDL